MEDTMDWRKLGRRLFVAAVLPILAVLIALGLVFSLPNVPDLFDAIRNA